MRSFALLFCACILLSLAIDATPTEDFTARGRELLANRKLSNPDRLHRLFDFSSEYTLKESPEFLPLSVLEAHIREWVAERKSA